jgi:hypothetical protein
VFFAILSIHTLPSKFQVSLTQVNKLRLSCIYDLAIFANVIRTLISPRMGHMMYQNHRSIEDRTGQDTANHESMDKIHPTGLSTFR